MNRNDEVLEGHLLQTAPLLAGMVTGAWLDSQEFAPLEYSVPGLISEGLGVLVGPPKAGKSWLVAAVGLGVAAGGRALGIPVNCRPVLYLALEDGHRRLQRRFRRITRDKPIPPINVITRAKPFQVLPIIDAFLDQYPEQQPLVIIDTLGKVKPPRHPGGDAYQDDYDFGGRLKETIDRVPGATLLVVHHTRKAESADFIDAVSGTHGIAGAADFIIVLARKRHSDNALLSVTGRDIPEGEYAVVTEQGLWRLDGADLAAAARAAENRREQQQLGDRALEVLALVNKRPETRAADLAEIGIPSDQARVYLNRLAESGRIKKTARGVYQCYLRSECYDPTQSPEGDVTDETEETPKHNGRVCGCGAALLTEESFSRGRCAECSIGGAR